MSASYSVASHATAIRWRRQRDPATLGGGDADKHLIYGGGWGGATTRMRSWAGAADADEADGVLDLASGACRASSGSQARTRAVIPRRLSSALGGNLPFERGLMFDEPTLRVFVVTTTVDRADPSRGRLSRATVGCASSTQANQKTLPDDGHAPSFAAVGCESFPRWAGGAAQSRSSASGSFLIVYLTTSRIDEGESRDPLLRGTAVGAVKGAGQRGARTGSRVRSNTCWCSS